MARFRFLDPLNPSTCPQNPGLTLTALSAPADTNSADGLKLLTSWATTELEPMIGG